MAPAGTNSNAHPRISLQHGMGHHAPQEPVITSACLRVSGHTLHTMTKPVHNPVGHCAVGELSTRNTEPVNRGFTPVPENFRCAGRTWRRAVAGGGDGYQMRLVPRGEGPGSAGGD